MLKSDASIMRQSRVEVDDYLDSLGVSSAAQLMELDAEFLEGLRLKIIPAQRRRFMALFEPQPQAVPALTTPAAADTQVHAATI